MLELLNFLKKENASKNIAKDRLKIIVLKDRNDCSPGTLESITEGFIDVLSTHAEFDEKDVDVKITSSEEGKPLLMVNVSIDKMKR